MIDIELKTHIKHILKSGFFPVCFLSAERQALGPLVLFFIEVRGAASNSAYYGYPELWILRYPAHKYHAVPSPGFEPTILWLRVRHPNHSATTLHVSVVALEM
jgi:hypothetical protein